MLCVVQILNSTRLVTDGPSTIVRAKNLLRIRLSSEVRREPESPIDGRAAYSINLERYALGTGIGHAKVGSTRVYGTCVAPFFNLEYSYP